MPASIGSSMNRMLRIRLEKPCWAHVRRKFYDIHQATQSPIALEALTRIAELYAIEEQIRGQPAR